MNTNEMGDSPTVITIHPLEVRGIGLRLNLEPVMHFGSVHLLKIRSFYIAHADTFAEPPDQYLLGPKVKDHRFKVFTEEEFDSGVPFPAFLQLATEHLRSHFKHLPRRLRYEDAWQFYCAPLQRRLEAEQLEFLLTMRALERKAAKIVGDEILTQRELSEEKTWQVMELLD